MDYETVSAEAFGASLRGIGLNPAGAGCEGRMCLLRDCFWHEVASAFLPILRLSPMAMTSSNCILTQPISENPLSRICCRKTRHAGAELKSGFTTLTRIGGRQGRRRRRRGPARADRQTAWPARDLYLVRERLCVGGEQTESWPQRRMIGQKRQS